MNSLPSSKGHDDPTEALAGLLPLRIDRVAMEGPTLLVGGPSWSLSATCDWRWVRSAGDVVSDSTDGADDLVLELVGDEIVAADWSVTMALGKDPSFTLRSGGTLGVISDAAFDTWVLHTPDLVIVGPLRDS